MVDVQEASDPESERPMAPGPGHVKKMISLFSSGLIVTGNELAPSDANNRSQVSRPVGHNDTATDDVKPSADDVDNCIKTNYVTSRILAFEGITDVDPSELKRIPVRQTAACLKRNSPIRTVPAGKQNGLLDTDHGSDKPLSTCDVILRNGHADGVLESRQANGCDHGHGDGSALLLNGAITHVGGTSAQTGRPPAQNGSLVNSNGSQQGEPLTETEPLPSGDRATKHEENGLPPSTTLTSDSSKKDGAYYLKIVDEEDKRLQASVSEMQAILETDPDIPEEASGLIRSAVGKGNLLIRKKFTHYRDCCMKNLHPDPNETRQTTSADLAGLWDIVCIQISDINDMFDQIKTLRKNGWKSPTKSGNKEKQLNSQPRKVPVTKTTRKGKTSATSDVSKDDKAAKAREEARIKAREEAKKRLLAAKKAGRQRKASQSDDVEIYIPS